MNTFMFRIVSIVFFVACAGLVYLGYILLRPAPYLSGEAPKKIVTTESAPELFEGDFFDETPAEVVIEIEPTVEEVKEEPKEAVSSKHASLISALQKLIDDKIFMKVSSRGTRVGTIQEFLNIYHTQQSRVDNDYGNGTKNRVMAFQKAVGITADGETGPQTYQKMIDWLQSQ
jgi:hypothetical protein